MRVRAAVSHALPPTAVVFTPRSPGAHVYYPLSRDKALLTSILIGCGRSRWLSCRARGRLHARRGGSAARAVAICCGRTVPMANDVHTCDLGARGLLPVGAARRLCRTVRTPPADRRGRAPRTLDAPALDARAAQRQCCWLLRQVSGADLPVAHCARGC